MGTPLCSHPGNTRVRPNMDDVSLRGNVQGTHMMGETDIWLEKITHVMVWPKHRPGRVRTVDHCVNSAALYREACARAPRQQDAFLRAPVLTVMER